MYSLLPLLYFFLLVTLLLLCSCRHEGVRPALPGLRGLLGVRLPVNVPVAPCFSFGELSSYLYFASAVSDNYVINVINNIRIRFIISFYVIYCSFCCIYVWLDPGTYMIARFMFFYKPGVTRKHSAKQRAESGRRNLRGSWWDKPPACSDGFLLESRVNWTDVINRHSKPKHQFNRC